MNSGSGSGKISKGPGATPKRSSAGRAPSGPPSRSADIHRAAGNLAVQSLLGGKRLPVSDPRDADERQARRTAEQFALRDSASATAPTGGSGRDGSSNELPRILRRSYEAFFDADLSGVRIHTDAAANHLADATRATAVTHGPNIYFAANRFDPQSKQGRKLLAHELAHVMQERAGMPAALRRDPALPAGADRSPQYELRITFR